MQVHSALPWWLACTSPTEWGWRAGQTLDSSKQLGEHPEGRGLREGVGIVCKVEVDTCVSPRAGRALGPGRRTCWLALRPARPALGAPGCGTPGQGAR